MPGRLPYQKLIRRVPNTNVLPLQYCPILDIRLRRPNSGQACKKKAEGLGDADEMETLGGPTNCRALAA